MAKDEGEKTVKAGAEYEIACAHAAAGRTAEAEAICRKILTADPSHAEALHLLGGIAHRRGQNAAAEDLLGKAIRSSPRVADYHNNLGAVLLGQGRADEAIARFEKAIELEPTLAMAHDNLGTVYRALGKLVEAEESLRRALALRPRSVQTLGNLGNTLKDQDKLDEAVSCYRKALAIRPDSAKALANLGSVLRIQGKLDEAEKRLRRAVEVKPDLASAHTNLSILLKDTGRYDEAEESLKRALEIDPDSAYAKTGLALLLLVLGDFGRAWELYVARQTVRNSPRALWQKPLPRDLRGKRLLIVKDQGLGDEIFFLRFAPELKRRGAEITHVADAKIGSIIARLAFIDRVAREGEDEPDEVDFTLSVGDLPLAVGMTSAADIPPPYPLPVEPGRAARMQARLEELGPPPYVGITWRAGSRLGKGDAKRGRRAPEGSFREISLAPLAAALRRLKATFLALQRNPEAGEIDDLARAVGRPVHDFTALNDDLEDMLALLALIDEYVTVSNTNVHLRAGTGQTSRVLVPMPPDYLWMAAGEESPWFPGCRVYRQKVGGSWAEALAALARDLTQASCLRVATLRRSEVAGRGE